MIRVIKAECIKLRRSPIWLAFLLMPPISALLGTINYSANTEILQNEWYSLWTQHTLFICYLILPLMLGIYCAYLMRLEYNNNNWNKVLTLPIPIYKVFLGKVAAAFFMLVISQVWIGILFVISGRIVGLDSPLPSQMLVWLMGGVLGGTVIIAIQLLLSAAINSFALPVGVALGGSISGIAALAKGFGNIYPYSLMAYGMNSNSPQVFDIGTYPIFILICIVYTVLFSAAGSIYLAKRDN